MLWPKLRSDPIVLNIPWAPAWGDRRIPGGSVTTWSFSRAVARPLGRILEAISSGTISGS